MKAIIWDCRVVALIEILKVNNPRILVLLETRVQGHRSLEILRRTCFSKVERVEARGFAGGIWMFWSESLVNIELIDANNKSISAIVRRTCEMDWLLTVIYARPHYSTRETLWEYICGLNNAVKGLWMLAVDLNTVVKESEKRGGAPFDRAKCQGFLNCMHHCCLIDLGFND
ncbi:hypothetical protein POM88_047975 [Heracleum sosnowskyi]|uniref:Endonuclease/exonuclease/phosphatase domain-containing protein n=1 Tax=Heracleum sosnowskyi TaxID=360622 RepID=A0AAD8GUW7_9APIA|nr:hypothetical protein POM88_047975 [Heracleum sosnowskyi]